jgi:hypothetical protein
VVEGGEFGDGDLLSARVIANSDDKGSGVVCCCSNMRVIQ